MLYKTSDQKLSKFFVGVTFESSSTLSKKIQGFRQHFDSKFSKKINSHLTSHMSLLAPFEILSKDKQTLTDSLVDEIDGFFFGANSAPKLGINGIGVWQNKRQHVLYLDPKLEENLKYCMESVQELCESFIPSQVNYKPNAKQFLPLGTFNSEEQLHRVMQHAQGEFANNSELVITGICLFEKKFGVWSVVHELISFDCTDNFLQLQHASI